MLGHSATRISQTLIILLLLLVAGATSSCTTTKPGDLVGTEKTGPREEVNTSYSISIVSPPASKDRAYTVQVRETPIYRVSYAEKREELTKRNPLFGSVLSVVGGAGFAIGFSAAPECFRKDRLECTESQEERQARNAKIAMGVSAGAFLLGVLSRRWANQDTAYTPSGEYVLGEERTRTNRGEPSPLVGERVNIRFGGATRKYKTDERGRITIDPARDFGLRTVGNPGPRIASVILPEREYTTSLSLDPRDWTIAYARIQATKAIRNRPSQEADRLQKARQGEELRIVNDEPGWLQVRRSGNAGWLTKTDVERFWAVPARLDPEQPPSVTASVDFQEPSGNERLDADETATIRLTVRNDGKGPAHRVRAYIRPETQPTLSYPSVIEFGRLGAGQSETQTIRIKAGHEIATEEETLTFRFQEANGFAPSPLQLQFETRKFIPPELTVADVGIDDASGNGIIEPGELVEVTARIRNQSRGRAENVGARLNFEGDNVFAGPDTRQSFDLGDLGPGEYRDIQFSLLTNQKAESVPVTVDLSEKYGEFGRDGIKLPLRFDTPTDQITQVRVEGQRASVDVQTTSNLSVDIENDIPTTPMDRPDAVAVVVGIRNYSSEGVPDVEYARRDARFMRKYLIETLGFREENILPRNPDGRMTYAELRTLIQQKLPGYVKKGTSEVFVYYSGHGAPSTGKDRHAYLIPSDTDPNLVSKANAYRLNQFYEDLGELGAESTTVVLDACFTGQDRSGDMLLRQASPLTLSVENPLLAMENATGFFASGPKQVANWYPEKKHGMFTYFFLKGLRGNADLDNDRKVTIGEMRRYLTDEETGVPYRSRRVHQREQVPQVQTSDASDVLVRFDRR